jgi:hypothetical protein
MLIKWENFGALLPRLLMWENILTGDILNGFYCNITVGISADNGSSTEKMQPVASWH